MHQQQAPKKKTIWLNNNLAVSCGTVLAPSFFTRATGGGEMKHWSNVWYTFPRRHPLFTIPSSIEPAVAGDICKDQSHRRSAQKRISLLFVDGFSSPVADKNLIGQLPDSLMSRGLPRKHWLWILPSRRGGESIVSAILLPAPVSLSSSAAAATIGFSIQFNSPAAVALPWWMDHHGAAPSRRQLGIINCCRRSCCKECPALWRGTQLMNRRLFSLSLSLSYAAAAVPLDRLFGGWHAASYKRMRMLTKSIRDLSPPRRHYSSKSDQVSLSLSVKTLDQFYTSLGSTY